MIFAKIMYYNIVIDMSIIFFDFFKYDCKSILMGHGGKYDFMLCLLGFRDYLHRSHNHGFFWHFAFLFELVLFHVGSFRSAGVLCQKESVQRGGRVCPDGNSFQAGGAFVLDFHGRPCFAEFKNANLAKRYSFGLRNRVDGGLFYE